MPGSNMAIAATGVGIADPVDQQRVQRLQPGAAEFTPEALESTVERALWAAAQQVDRAVTGNDRRPDVGVGLVAERRRPPHRRPTRSVDGLYLRWGQDLTEAVDELDDRPHAEPAQGRLFRRGQTGHELDVAGSQDPDR